MKIAVATKYQRPVDRSWVWVVMCGVYSHKLDTYYKLKIKKIYILYTDYSIQLRSIHFQQKAASDDNYLFFP